MGLISNQDFQPMIDDLAFQILNEGYYEYCCVMESKMVQPDTCRIENDQQRGKLSFRALLKLFNLKLVQHATNEYQIDLISPQTTVKNHSNRIKMHPILIDGEVRHDARLEYYLQLSKCMAYLDVLYAANVQAKVAWGKIWRSLQHVKMSLQDLIPTSFQDNYNVTHFELLFDAQKKCRFTINVADLWQRFWYLFDHLADFQQQTKDTMEHGWSLERIIYQPKLLHFEPNEKLVALRQQMMTLSDILQQLKQNGFFVHPDLANVTDDQGQRYADQLYVLAKPAAVCQSLLDCLLKLMKTTEIDNVQKIVSDDASTLCEESLLFTDGHDRFRLDHTYEQLRSSLPLNMEIWNQGVNDGWVMSQSQWQTWMQDYSLDQWLHLVDQIQFQHVAEKQQLRDKLQQVYQQQDWQLLIDQHQHVTSLGSQILLMMLYDQFKRLTNADLDRLGFDPTVFDEVRLVEELKTTDLQAQLAKNGVKIDDAN